MGNCPPVINGLADSVPNQVCNPLGTEVHGGVAYLGLGLTLAWYMVA